jgi:hypothetical protein
MPTGETLAQKPIGGTVLRVKGHMTVGRDPQVGDGALRDSLDIRVPLLIAEYAVLLTALNLLAVAPLLLFAAEKESQTGGGRFESIHALSMNRNGRMLFLGTHFGLFQSTDAGVTWKSIGEGSLTAVVVNPKRREEVYALSTSGVIFRSLDGGMTSEQLK